MDCWKISRKSWTYRFLKWRGLKPLSIERMDFCAFYKTLIKEIVCVVGFCAFVFGIATMFGWAVGEVLLKKEIISSAISMIAYPFIGGLLLGGWVAVLAPLVWLIAQIIDFIDEYQRNRKKKPGFIATLIAAKKKKYCPMVTYED